MIRFRTLGALDLRGPDGAELGSILAQPKRTALLAYLAAAGPRGFHRRDTLLALFWPELDEAHARNALSKAVHHLRRSLGEGVLVGRGDEELGLSAERFWCDAAAFDQASGAGDFMAALELYRGDLLEGFFLSDAPEFVRWVEGERERLARMYARALEGRAAEEETRGDFSAAAEVWHRLAARDPHNSRVALRLMRALEAAGDRAGAIRHAATHAARLREEIGAEPDSEIVALAERLRCEPAGRVEPGAKRRDGEGNGAGLGTVALPPLRVGAVVVSPPSARRTDDGNGAAAPEAQSTQLPVSAQRHRRILGLALRWGGALVVGGLVVLLGMFWLRQPRSPTLHPQRVVVAPFENRTGDPSLDPIGSMAADWITQGLSQAAIVEVVPTTAAFNSARHVRAAAAASPGLDPIRALAEETGAGLVISGSYYREDDSLQILAQITDARRDRLLRSVEPVRAAARAPTVAIELLRQRALAALAPLLDTRLAAHVQLSSQPPTYEAYRAYAEGMEATIASDWGEAIEHFERAAALDSTYLLPQLLIAIAYMNVGSHAAADSMYRELNQSRERLAAYDRALLDVMMSLLGDDPAARYEAAKRAAALAPGSLPHVQWGAEAFHLNRPREAIRILSQIDPTRGEVRGWAVYWQALTASHHMLGNYRRELKEVRKARALHPDDPMYLWLEARALAALGRLAEVEEVLNARLLLPAQKGDPPEMLMRQTGDELRVHGHAEAARSMYARAIARYRSLPADQQRPGRYEYGRLLLAAERWNEAQPLFRQLAAEAPENIRYQGALGVLAAQRGDLAEAERIAAWLAARKGPYLWGYHTYWRACIAAQLGRKAEAVALLRKAHGEDPFHAWRAHADPCLGPLRDYPPFRELLRPKG